MMTNKQDDRCPKEELFVARYASGGCNDDERGWFEVHLERCETCTGELRSVRRALEALASWEPPPINERRRQQYRDEFRRAVAAKYRRSWRDSVVSWLDDLSRIPKPVWATAAVLFVAMVVGTFAAPPVGAEANLGQGLNELVGEMKLFENATQEPLPERDKWSMFYLDGRDKDIVEFISRRAETDVHQSRLRVPPEERAPGVDIITGTCSWSSGIVPRDPRSTEEAVACTPGLWSILWTRRSEVLQVLPGKTVVVHHIYGRKRGISNHCEDFYRSKSPVRLYVEAFTNYRNDDNRGACGWLDTSEGAAAETYRDRSATAFLTDVLRDPIRAQRVGRAGRLGEVFTQQVKDLALEGRFL